MCMVSFRAFSGTDVHGQRARTRARARVNEYVSVSYGSGPRACATSSVRFMGGPMRPALFDHDRLEGGSATESAANLDECVDCGFLTR
jgi:hypothetical protein